MKDEETAHRTDQVRQVIDRYHREYRDVPAVTFIAQTLGLSRGVVAETLRELERQGDLVRSGNRYQLARSRPSSGFSELTESPSPSSSSRGASPKAEKKKQPSPSASSSKKDPPKKKAPAISKVQFHSDLSLIVIRTVMVLVGVTAAWLSVYYTRTWLLEFLSPTLAAALAGSMVLFSISAFESMVVFRQNRQPLLIAVFAVVWAVVLVFSMVSTVAGQYNARVETKEKAKEDRAESSALRAQLDTLESEERMLSEQMKRKLEKIDNLQRLMSQFDSLEKRREDRGYWWVDTTNRLKEAEEELAEIRDRLSGVREEKKELLSREESAAAVSDPEPVPSFYAWAGSIIKAEPDRLQFWLSVFPAVFIDVIAPLALAVGMFLKRRENE